MAALAIILLVCAAASMIMAQRESAKFRSELANKRPELRDLIYGFRWYPSKSKRLLGIYKAEFPGSRRVAHGWLWFLAFVIFGFSGFVLFSAAFRN